jgi:hypothetical protein
MDRAYSPRSYPKFHPGRWTGLRLDPLAWAGITSHLRCFVRCAINTNLDKTDFQASLRDFRGIFGSLLRSRFDLGEAFQGLRTLGVEVRVSHISPKEGEIWGTLWLVAGIESCPSIIFRQE